MRTRKEAIKMIIIPIRLIIVVLASFLVIARLLRDESRRQMRQIKGEVMRLFEKGGTKNKVLTEADIQGLPDPVQRWLRYSRVIGKEKAITVRLRQGGFFRMKPDQGWKPLKAEEYYTTDAPAFIWHGRISLFPFVPIVVRDMYDEGKGQMLVKLLSLIKLVDVYDSYEINQGTLLRYLNEMMWFPSAALNDYIQWEAIDSSSARAIMSYQGVTAPAVFHFNESGQLTNFVAYRYREAGGQFILTKWSTPISDYGTFDGIRIPTKGQGVWHLDSGEFSYIKVEITELEYNNPSLY